MEVQLYPHPAHGFRPRDLLIRLGPRAGAFGQVNSPCEQRRRRQWSRGKAYNHLRRHRHRHHRGGRQHISISSASFYLQKRTKERKRSSRHYSRNSRWEPPVAWTAPSRDFLQWPFLIGTEEPQSVDLRRRRIIHDRLQCPLS
ncbi:hypothetical protein B296_00045016 [Ensete ventricosum]|uniref:Uncharacterized protein n=1 Tax=Ensete ventricosum TaxID=4639 RepID=A0A426XHZ8_ENSVE|nr:hypothetical protein B296_00045016 [Ensete ventricosum]